MPLKPSRRLTAALRSLLEPHPLLEEASWGESGEMRYHFARRAPLVLDGLLAMYRLPYEGAADEAHGLRREAAEGAVAEGRRRPAVVTVERERSEDTPAEDARADTVAREAEPVDEVRAAVGPPEERDARLAAVDRP